MKFLLEQNGTPCGVEVDGVVYSAVELERVLRAALNYQNAVRLCDGIATAEAELFDALGGFVSVLQNSLSDGTKLRCCAVADCTRRAFSTHRYCTMHRLRMERTGDPTLAHKRGPKGRK